MVRDIEPDGIQDRGHHLHSASHLVGHAGRWAISTV